MRTQLLPGRLLVPLLTTSVLTACSPQGPASCRALEACCDGLGAGAADGCRQAIDQARASPASEQELDAACEGALESYRASGACTRADEAESDPSGLVLSVLGVGYLPRSGVDTSRASLFVVVSLENAEEGAVVALAPGLFTLHLEGGVGVVGQYVSDSPDACSPDLLLLSGGRVSCALSFAPPLGSTPSALGYASPDGRGARAAIPRCGAAAPTAGYCPEGESCAEGRCRVASWRPDEPLVPEPELEPIPEGCADFSALPSGCTSCLVESGCLSLPAQCPSDCEGCFSAPTAEERCACQAERCDGCFQPILECFAESCPSCR